MYTYQIITLDNIFTHGCSTEHIRFKVDNNGHKVVAMVSKLFVQTAVGHLRSRVKGQCHEVNFRLKNETVVVNESSVPRYDKDNLLYYILLAINFIRNEVLKEINFTILFHC